MVWVLIQIKNNNNLPCNFKIVVVKNTKNFDNILFNIDKILINSQILDVTFFFCFCFFSGHWYNLSNYLPNFGVFLVFI